MPSSNSSTITQEFRAAHYLIDGMARMPAQNVLYCRCGVRIYPDCDVSAASISEAYTQHLVDMGATREDLDAFFGRLIPQEG